MGQNPEDFDPVRPLPTCYRPRNPDPIWVVTTRPTSAPQIPPLWFPRYHYGEQGDLLHGCLDVIALRSAALLAAMLVLSPPTLALDMDCQKYTGWSLDSANFAKSFPSGRKPKEGTCISSVTLRGPIVAGDADKFANMLRQAHPFLGTVYLHSPGGNVREAMKIGRMIRKHLIETKYGEEKKYEPPDPPNTPWYKSQYYKPRPTIRTSHCSSACFLIWAAGIERSGSDESAIGLHRPIPTDLDKMAPGEASAIYRQAMIEVEAYLREMEVPPSFFRIMENTPSSSVYWLSEKQVESLEHVPSIEEWIAAECGVEPPSQKLGAWYVCRSPKLNRARDAIR
jgi:hypothetical protein